MNYQDIITIEPGKRGGKPCIRGLRITVHDVLDQLAAGMSNMEILEDFPELTIEDIHACLAFAADRERRIGELSSLQGKYRDIMSSSEEFARRKQEEIELEEAKWKRRTLKSD
jgi:uncharacterized protein (DUF433 family)